MHYNVFINRKKLFLYLYLTTQNTFLFEFVHRKTAVAATINNSYG